MKKKISNTLKDILSIRDKQEKLYLLLLLVRERNKKPLQKGSFSLLKLMLYIIISILIGGLTYYSIRFDFSILIILGVIFVYIYFEKKH